jgi:hypothetical protein
VANDEKRSLAARLTMIETIVGGSVVAIMFIWLGSRRRDSEYGDGRGPASTATGSLLGI